MKDGSDPSELLELLRRYLERRYGIQIVAMDRLDRRIYRASLKVGPSWVVRAFSARREAERVQGDADLLNFLESQGFPAERCARPDAVTNPRGRGVLVTKFVEGKKPECSPGTLRSLGELLGRLNTLPADSGAPAREAGALHVYTPNEGLPRRDLASAGAWLDGAQERVPSQNRGPLESLRAQLSRADDCGDLPRALIHPDPVMKNVIESEGQMILVDWTGAGRGPRVLPLALLIWSCALLGDGRWSPERVDPIVEGYSSKIRLERDEVQRLGSAMKVRPLVFACWRYSHATKVGKIPDGTEWWWPNDELADSIAGRTMSLLRT